MNFTVTDLRYDSNNCKDLIIKALSGKPALSAKKIHNHIEQEFQAKISYQAVHKMLGALTKDKVLKKFENDYYLNSEWINYLHSFVGDLKEKKMIGSGLQKEEESRNYNSLLKIKAFRFIPFHLGKPKISNLPKAPVILKKTKERISFRLNNYLYFWYNTGVCVQVVDEEGKNINVINFLLERRKVHHNLLNFQAPASKEILKLTKQLNPSSKQRLGYVMSIHSVNFPEKTSLYPNMLKLITEPGILGIHDNPKIEIDNKMIKNARNKLYFLSDEEIENQNIYEVSVDKTKKLLASWSNVVFCCDEDDFSDFSSQLIELETDLQHLWFYFHSLKNEIRRQVRHNNKPALRRLLQQKRNCLNLWHGYENIGAQQDSQTLLIKEALIKTSKIEKIYSELNQLFSYCEEELKKR